MKHDPPGFDEPTTNWKARKGAAGHTEGAAGDTEGAAGHTGIGDWDPRFRFRIPDSGFGISGSGKQIQIQIQDSETWCQDLGSLIPDPRFCLSPLLSTIAYLCFSPLLSTTAFFHSKAAIQFG